MIAPVEREIRRRLGRYIYGTDGEGIGAGVNSLLQRCGVALATMEIATGGSLCTLLGGEGDTSSYRGGIVLSRPGDLISICPASGGEKAAAMEDPRTLQILVARVKELFQAEVGLVIWAPPPPAVPAGGRMTPFPVAVETPRGFLHAGPQVRATTPEMTRHRITLAAIAFLREALLPLEQHRP